MIAGAPRLRAIARAGAGHDAVDLAAATARRIAVSITPGANAESVAEHVFALLLALTRNVIDNDRLIRAGAWDRDGPSGRCGARRWASSGWAGSAGRSRGGRSPSAMRVVAYGRHADAIPGHRPGSTLDDLLAESDVVSLHLPLTAATRGLFDRRAFARMRPGAPASTPRGESWWSRTDLAESLASGHLGGAGLDVLDAEPPEPGQSPAVPAERRAQSPHRRRSTRRRSTTWPSRPPGA